MHDYIIMTLIKKIYLVIIKIVLFEQAPPKFYPGVDPVLQHGRGLKDWLQKCGHRQARQEKKCPIVEISNQLRL